MLSTVPLGVAAGGASAAGSAAAGSAAAGSAAAEGRRLIEDLETGAEPGPEIFRSIGVEPVINCRGTYTIIGGSVERPEVRQAMDAASQSYVQYDELADGIGRRLAELTGADWGIVTAGCAAAMKHATAACVAGGNPERLIRIPDLSRFEKKEVVIPRGSRNAYDHAVRNIGVDVITVETPEEFEQALSRRTAMVYIASWQSEPLDLKTVARLAEPHGVPILMDAAAEDLTVPNYHLQNGATMVCYSGGKALRGPQCAGLLLGPKDLMMAAWQASSPHHGPGRDNKVGREEMMGMLAAVEAWVDADHEAEWEQWLAWLDHIAERVTAIDGVEARVEEPTIPGMDHPGEPAPISNHSPVLHLMWDPGRLHVTGEQVQATLGRTKPRIVVGSGYDDETERTSINITAWMMQPGEDEVVAERIHELLTEERGSTSGAGSLSAMSAPGATLAGRWTVEVEFFSSASEHTWFIEKQDENWLEGSHQGDFSTRDIAGTIEGREVKLLSTDRPPGDRLEYIFAGRLSEGGDRITGDVHLGEYLTATFTARRHAYDGEREAVRVPDGPPLAT